MMKEIKNFPNYFITDTGDVYSKKNKAGTIKKLNTIKARNGYLRIWFTD